MRHIQVEPPAFFHRGLSPLARLTFFGLVSIALLFADTRFRYLEHVRTIAAVALAPLQRIALMPRDAFDRIADYFRVQASLVEENAVLARRLVEVAPRVQGYALLQRENERLKGLLELQSRYPGAATAVEVLYTGRDPFSQKLFIDKGIEAGLVPGQAVVDADGVVGQLTRVYPLTAEVTLVTDKDHAVPVKVERSGVRSVLFGAGAGRLPELRFMAPNADIEVGDLLVTSGIDGTYPPGLAVARVAALERDTGQMFARILAKPLAGADRSRYLMVLGKVATPPAPPEETAQPDVARRGGAKAKAGRRGVAE